MKIVLFSILAAIAGYIAGVLIGMLAVNLFSSNAHDKSLEAAMSSFFIYGPLAALLAFASALIYQLSRRGH